MEAGDLTDPLVGMPRSWLQICAQLPKQKWHASLTHAITLLQKVAEFMLLAPVYARTADRVSSPKPFPHPLL
jgi:hypothetical protein